MILPTSEVMQHIAEVEAGRLAAEAFGRRSQGTGPMCRCGARNTARIGDSALTRQCQACGQTYRYLLKDGLLIPTALETALAMEGK